MSMIALNVGLREGVTLRGDRDEVDETSALRPPGFRSRGPGD